MIRRHVLHALSLLLAAGAHAAPPSTLRLERTLGDERFQEDAEIETILPLDDHRVVTLSYGAAVKAWDRDSGKLLAWTRPDWDEGFFDVLPLPGSDRLVLATPSRGHFLWRPGNPPELLPATNEVTSCIAWHPAGFLADIGEGGEVRLVDPAHPERTGLSTIDHPVRLGVFTPDGKRLVGVREEDRCAPGTPPPPGRRQPGNPSRPWRSARRRARPSLPGRHPPTAPASSSWRRTTGWPWSKPPPACANSGTWRSRT
ncbi:MAG: WD40 repeat domain-containing protein [Kiritimatiellia bacterium]